MVALFAVAFLVGKTLTIVLFALTSFYCLREFLSLTPTRPEDHRPIVAAFYLFIPLQYWLVWDRLAEAVPDRHSGLGLPAAAGAVGAEGRDRATSCRAPRASSGR